MKAWWRQLQTRQRVLIGAGGLILIAVFAFTTIWEPLDQARERERNRVAQQQALADWLEAVAPLARELRQSGSVRSDNLADRSLLGRVDETARAAGLAGVVQRIEPSGDDRVRVWLEEAPFTGLMDWLVTLAAEQGIHAEQLTAERTGSPGTASIRLTLVAGDPGSP